MMVWLHTNSPPQHIDNVSEQAFIERGRNEFYLQSVKETRGLECEFCGVFEYDGGRTQVQVFDTKDRADAWMLRNQDVLYII